MVAEIAQLVTNGLILPVLIFLALRLQAVEKSNQKVLDWLEKNCPQCGAIRLFSADK